MNAAASEPTEPAIEAAGPIVPVILSGGSGTRLWPVSRESFPKQFWPLLSDRSLIEETARRAVGPGFAAPIVVCNQEHRFLVAEQMRHAGVTKTRIVLEPVGRNSAPAVAAAALLVAEENAESVLWIMAADAAISDVTALHGLLATAVTAARAGRIVLFGVRPTAPETGYGYIEMGPPLPGLPGVHDIVRFVEKPDGTTAAALIADGRHLWNCGMFVATAATILAELGRHVPNVLDGVRAAVAARVRDLDFIRLATEPFSSVNAISLDYAVAERTDRAAVIRAELGWSDIGSWGALWELGKKDADGNVAVGNALLESARHCYVRSDGVLTAVVGLQDAIVVVTEDAVLAMHRDRSQDVKRIVDRLRVAGRHEAVSHNRFYRPWGFFETLFAAERFRVRRVVVMPGHRLSLHKHFHRAEHITVLAGTALVTHDGIPRLISENESADLPIGCLHRIENPGRIPLTLIEVQAGSYLGADDVVRIEDDYGLLAPPSPDDNTE